MTQEQKDKISRAMLGSGSGITIKQIGGNKYLNFRLRDVNGKFIKGESNVS